MFHLITNAYLVVVIEYGTEFLLVTNCKTNAIIKQHVTSMNILYIKQNNAFKHVSICISNIKIIYTVHKQIHVVVFY